MNIGAPKLTLLQQREIEARIVRALDEGVCRGIRQERTLTVLRQVIGDLARQGGAGESGTKPG